MNESLQQLETKVENQGATPQGKVSAAEWNVLVAAVKALDSAGINDESLKKYLQQYQYITRPELSGILEDATPDLSGVVTTSGEQDIFGIKNFVNGLKLSNKLIRYDADKNVFVFPANAIFEGGVAWNSSLDGFEPQTVTDAVNVDGVTIGRTTSGALTVLAGAGGGINEAQLADYLTNNNYAKKSDIPSLSGYATEAFVTSRGYITSAAIPTKVSTFDNDSGYITGITSSMVTSALGYTPYNVASFTKANIKSTLGISDWALASAKPSYNTSEINNNSQIFQGRTDAIRSNVNGDDFTNAGAYLFQTGNGTGFENFPLSGYGILNVFHGLYNNLQGRYVSQLLLTRTQAYFRTKIDTWGDWIELAKVSDIPTKLSQFTDDIVKGKYLSTSGGTVNGVLSIQSVLQLSDIDNTYKVVLQRDSSGNILFGAGFADSNMYIDADVLRIRSNNTIFSREISTTGLVLRSGSQSATISYNAAKNAFVFPANAIFEGGVAWNSPMDGTSAYASELERRIEALQTEVDTMKQTVQTLTA